MTLCEVSGPQHALFAACTGDVHTHRALTCDPECVLRCRHAYRCFWSHLPSEELTGSGHIAIQRMAHAAGLALLEPNSHLCLHPKFGPWLALRCALVFDSVPYTEPQIAPRMKPLSPSTQQYIQMAMKSAMRKPSMSLEDAGRYKQNVCLRHALQARCHLIKPAWFASLCSSAAFLSRLAVLPPEQLWTCQSH